MHLSFFTFALAAATSGLEAIFGYPAAIFRSIGHPVTWMGHLIAALDRLLNRDDDPPIVRAIAGGLATAILLLVTALCTQALMAAIFGLFGSGVIGFVALVLSTSPCLAQRSLAAHVSDVAHALDTEGLEEARLAVACIVGRDVTQLDSCGIARAAIESLAENFSDAIVAPALWIALIGPLGGFLYKAINTADSMIGHRTARHKAFGFAAAKLDDLVNLAPARLSALWICLAADNAQSRASAWRVVWRDARGHPSPNAGWPEAAVAGALGVKLGGPRVYGSRAVEDSWIGEGRSDLTSADIDRALRLYRRACAVNFGVLLVLAALLIAQG